MSAVSRKKGFSLEFTIPLGVWVGIDVDRVTVPYVLFVSPVHFFIGALHFIDVHADVVSDVRRRVAGVGLQVFKDDSSPEGLTVQELQCSVHQVALVGDGLKLVQVQTLAKNKNAI